MLRTRGLMLAAAVCLIAGCETYQAGDTSAPHRAGVAVADMTLGNGEANRIELEGARLYGAVLTIPKVFIDTDGFLVVHPVANGQFSHAEYLGATYIREGETRRVGVDLRPVAEPGDRLVIMLYRDTDRDQVFDFVGGVTKPDAPLIEGNTLVALRWQVPQ